MERRDFLRSTIGAAGGAAVFGSITAPVPAGAGVLADSVRVVKTVTTSQAGGLYTPNRAPLRATPFLRLPPGSITPGGWIRHQLDLRVNGLNGRMPEVSDYLRHETCGWVDPAKNAWEELPYWLRGFGDLGYVTGDQRVLSLTRGWVDGIIATQQPDGWFGPRALRTSLEGGPDFWPHMPLLNVLRSFQEYTGDSRVILFMTGYFRFQNGQPPVVFSRGWAALRWGDNIDSVFWLYDRTGEPWLLDLVRKIHAGSADYTGGIPNWHNVNLAQGFREPAEFGLLAGETRFRDATYRNYDTIMRSYGQFSGGGFAGDENVRTGHDDPRQGFETCGIVEFMHSHQMLTHITGDPVWADRCEELAFNSLPAAMDPAQKGVLYIVTANGVQLDRHRQDTGPVPERLGHAGLHAGRAQPPVLPPQLRHGLAVLRRGAVAGDLRQRAVRLDVRPVLGAGQGRERHERDDRAEYRLSLRRDDLPAGHHAEPCRLPALPARPRLVGRGEPAGQRHRGAGPGRPALLRRPGAHLEQRRHRHPPAPDARGGAGLGRQPRLGWRPEGVWFRIQNRNSGKVLGVDQMSTADGARVVQYADKGTADHLWRFT